MIDQKTGTKLHIHSTWTLLSNFIHWNFWLAIFSQADTLERPVLRGYASYVPLPATSSLYSEIVKQLSSWLV